MKLLLTNDDGWDAEGLAVLKSVASEFGDVWAVAPADAMSGISHQITFERPLELKETGPQSFSLSGTPADCVRIAIVKLGVDFDWVLSGVNNGANLGADIHVSGTVAATREAVLHGCRSIALSQYRRKFKKEYDWSQTAKLSRQVLNELIGESSLYGVAAQLEGAAAINVNLPDLFHIPAEQVTESQINGVAKLICCELDRNPLPLDYHVDENGRYLFQGEYEDRPRSAGSDIAVCFAGDVSISKLNVI